MMGTKQPEKTTHRRMENVKLFGDCGNTNDQNNQFTECQVGMEEGDKNCDYKNSYSNWWEYFELLMFEVMKYVGGLLINKVHSQLQIYSNVSKLSAVSSVWVLYVHVLPSRSISTLLVGMAFKGLRLQN